MKINLDDINSFIESQLSLWPDAKKNYDDLATVRRKPLRVGDFTAYAQYNPARIVSTGARTDRKTISERKCFLCKDNRPEQQIGGEWIPGWEFLVNPFPILPVHFTLPHLNHTPQSGIPLDMAAMAENAPDLMFFFNGAKAGASAPDHLHCQAVLKSEVPLVRYIEERHSPDLPTIVSAGYLSDDFPFLFISAIISPTPEGMKNIMKMVSLQGVNNAGEKDPGLVNSYFWIDGHSGCLRIVVIPRRAHRPECFFREDDSRIMVSPGALDMAGLVILPIEKDFDKITEFDLKEIYSQVALPPNFEIQTHNS